VPRGWGLALQQNNPAELREICRTKAIYHGFAVLTYEEYAAGAHHSNYFCTTNLVRSAIRRHSARSEA